MTAVNFQSRILCLLGLGLALLIPRLPAQPVVVDYGTTNTFTASAVATNFSWTLDGITVGGNSNSFSYTPQIYDVGTHYLLANQTLPGTVSSNSYWAVRVRISLPVSGANYYVATNGSDSNAGNLAAPFLTLEKARNTIRALARPLPAGGVTVWLRGGTYFRTNTLMLTNVNDSGNWAAPIVYRSYSNETAVISGGTSIAASGWTPLNSSQTNRVAPGVNPTNIWELDLAGAGITHATNFPADFNQWTTFNTYNQGVDGGLCELIYNGQRQFLSRYPNHNLTNDDLLTTNMLMDGVAKGQLNSSNEMTYPTGGDSTNSLNYPGTYTNSSGQAIPVGGAFYCKTNDVARFTRWQSAITNGGFWLQGYWRVPWQIDGIKIIGFDVTNRAVLLDTNAHPGGGIGNKYTRPGGNKAEPFWVPNLLEEMDQPGEWAVDFNRKKIYFYAPGPLADGSVVISDFGSPLVQIGGGSNIVFQSVNFEAALAQTILITNAMNNFVLGCNFNNVNNYAVDINGGGTNGVVSCNLQNLAAGGVLLRGGIESTNAALRVPARDFIVNNVITNFGRVVRVYAAAVDAGFGGAGGSGGGGGHTACVGMRTAHNNISISPHCAVLVGSWDTIHEYNDISRYQLCSEDLGAYYSYDYIWQHGNHTFRYNFLHDSPLGNGIDFDEDHPQMHIYGNIINLNTTNTYPVGNQTAGDGIRYQNGTQITNGNEQTIECYNNLSINCHWPAIFEAALPSVIGQNVGISCSNGFVWTLVVSNSPLNLFQSSTAAAMQTGTNLTYASDPGFINAAINDFRLAPSSQIYSDTPTFKQIPIELIGLYNDEFRTNAGGYSPFIVTSNATAVTGTNAVINGRLFFPQFESNTTVTVYYGPTDGGSNALAWQSSANLGIFAAGSVGGALGWLPGGTNYFRLYAANAFGSSWSPTSFTVVTPATVITNVTPSQAVWSNSIVNYSGQVVATGPLYPMLGETVSVIINGVATNTTVTNTTGNFSVTFNTTNVSAYGSPYVVTYIYGGNASIASATNTSTTLTIASPTVTWSGAAGTNFETGGLGGNWSDFAAPINDLISCTAIFAATPPANQPSLTTSRSVKGLSFGATNGGWTLGSGSKNYFLSLGADGLSSLVQTNGTNVIGAGLNVAANQTWQVGTGGTLLFTGAITNSAAPVTNYSLAFDAASANGTVILSPGAGNFIKLTGTNGAAVLQLANGGLLELGGDGVTAPVTASTNYVVNDSGGSGSLKVIGGASRVQVNSGTWNFGDFSRNAASDALSGTLDVNVGGTVSFSGARYIGGGTINVNGGTLRFANTNSLISNGAMFQLGWSGTGTATMNLSAGLVDVAVSAVVGGVGSGIGAGQSALLNQSGGILRNGLTPGSSANNTSFSIGGLPYAGGLNNNRSAFTLTGGTLLSAGTVLGGTNATVGSMNNFNFMGGVLAVQSFNATNLGSSPAATVLANQTNVSLAIGTLVNFGGTLAPGNLGVPGKTIILGNYAVSNNAAVLAIDIGGTNQANAFQNGVTNYDFVSVTGNSALGGNLNINLINSFVPATTNSFVILTNGGTLTGNFTNLGGGRVAVANIVGGSFKVVTNARSVVLTNFVLSPVIGSISYSGTNFFITGTNGTAGASCLVLSATNLFVPLTNWSIIATNQFGLGGSVNFTSPLNLNTPQKYYRLQLP